MSAIDVTPDDTSADDSGAQHAAPGDSDADAAPRHGRLRRVASAVSVRGRVVPVTVAGVAVLSVAAAGTAYATVYRSDESSSRDEVPAIVSAANDGAVAILSYSPKTLDADFTKAKSHLTGQFLTYYQEFTEKVVKPAATQNDVDTDAKIVRSAVSSVDGDSAEVLAFINQSTKSSDKAEPELTSSSVKIALQRVDGEWRISSFDPV